MSALRLHLQDFIVIDRSVIGTGDGCRKEPRSQRWPVVETLYRWCQERTGGSNEASDHASCLGKDQVGVRREK